MQLDTPGSEPGPRDQADATGIAATHFRVLGPVSITAGPNVAVLQPSRPATLLAMLLLYPNTIVAVESLVRAVWDEDPPATAKAALQTCVLRLRRLFARHGVVGADIEAVAGGYRIAARDETLDLIRFRQLTRKAGAEPSPEDELRLLRGALGLWHGPLLANVHSDVVHREEIPRLVEERLRAVERVFDISLALDRCRSVLPELLSAARMHPAHERFWEQLIEALYRTGRRAQALTEYRRVKDYLRDELGVDPGPGLQRLEMKVLRGEGFKAEETGARRAEGRATVTLQAGTRTVVTGTTVAGEPATGTQVIDRLLEAGLLTKLPEGRYHMHELLHVLTRHAAFARAAVADADPAAG